METENDDDDHKDIDRTQDTAESVKKKVIIHQEENFKTTS